MCDHAVHAERVSDRRSCASEDLENLGRGCRDRIRRDAAANGRETGFEIGLAEPPNAGHVSGSWLASAATNLTRRRRTKRTPTGPSIPAMCRGVKRRVRVLMASCVRER